MRQTRLGKSQQPHFCLGVSLSPTKSKNVPFSGGNYVKDHKYG